MFKRQAYRQILFWTYFEHIVCSNFTPKCMSCDRFVSQYVDSIAAHYLHLDEHSLSSPSFILFIRNAVKKESMKRRSNWTVLEFMSTIADPTESTSNETYSGLFLRAPDLPKLVHFLSTFDNVPHQIHLPNVTLYTTYDIFIRVVSQGSRLVQRPALFHRRVVGANGSMDLEVEDVGSKRWKSDDPSGKIVTSMVAVGSHRLSFVYGYLLKIWLYFLFL